jgi:hypothetical protein
MLPKTRIRTWLSGGLIVVMLTGLGFALDGLAFESKSYGSGDTGVGLGIAFSMVWLSRLKVMAARIVSI